MDVGLILDVALGATSLALGYLFVRECLAHRAAPERFQIVAWTGLAFLTSCYGWALFHFTGAGLLLTHVLGRL